LRPAALDAVAGPAIALLVVGIISIVGWCLIICLGFLGFTMDGPGRRGGFGRGGDEFVLLAGLLVYTIPLVASIVLVAFASKMRRLESYAGAMAASILAVIPCLSPCIILGIPFGIWALVVINQPDVKEAFYH
jgi:hypothetical protein